jgi:hypothetical protein
MTTNRPLWLLDVDGVINALPEDRGVPDGYKRVKVNGFWITYRPRLVEFIRDLHESGRVEVRWLTTWCDKAAELLAPELGLPLTCVVEGTRELVTGRASWWKAQAATRVLAADDTRPVIWTDDDLSYGNRAGELEWLRHYPSTTLLISPDPCVGLTDEQLDRIEEFLVATEEAAA